MVKKIAFSAESRRLLIVFFFHKKYCATASAATGRVNGAISGNVNQISENPIPLLMSFQCRAEFLWVASANTASAIASANEDEKNPSYK